MNLVNVKTGIMVLSLGVGAPVIATHQYHKEYHKHREHHQKKHQRHHQCVEKTWEVYGQLNKALQMVGDSNERKSQVVDNDNSSSRVGVTGEFHHDRVFVGGRFETEFTGASSRHVSQNKVGPTGQYAKGVDGRGPFALAVRHADTWLRGNAGTLSLGKGSMASDETSTLSFSGADVVANANVSSMAGGYLFHVNGSSEVYGYENQVSEVFTDINGFRRQNRVRYDFPTFHNFTLSTSVANSDRHYVGMTAADADPATGNTAGVNWAYREKRRVGQRYLTDLAVRYQEKFNGCEAKAALAFGRTSYGNAVNRERLWDGSLAVLHNDSGLNAAVAVGRQSQLQEIPVLTGMSKAQPTWPRKKFFYVQVGKQHEFCQHGKTNLVVDYWQGKDYLAYNVKNNSRVTYPDRTALGNRSRSVGFAVVQELCKLNTDVYAGWRSYRLKLPTNIAYVESEPVGVAMLGFRVHLSMTN